MSLDTAHFEHDIFLLMLNLSQVKSSEQIRGLFLEVMNSFWNEIQLRFWAGDEETDSTVFEISTRHHSFGHIAIDGQVERLTTDEIALIHNTIGEGSMFSFTLPRSMEAGPDEALH